MTYRAKGWLFAVTVSLALWVLVALVADEAVMLWGQPLQELTDDHDA